MVDVWLMYGRRMVDIPEQTQSRYVPGIALPLSVAGRVGSSFQWGF